MPQVSTGVTLGSLRFPWANADVRRQKPGIEIARRRDANGWSLRELADAAGVDKMAIHRMEKGAWGDPDAIVRVAAALGCSAHDLEYPEVPAPRTPDDGVPLDASTDSGGIVTGRTLEAWQTPALRRESPHDEAILPAKGAAERWFAARLGPVTPDMVSRDPGGTPWRLDEGDIIIFRPTEDGEQPNDAIVVVAIEDPDSEGMPIRHEVRIAQRIGGKRTALHPVAPGVEPAILKRDWEIIAVGVEVRRPL